MRVFILNQNEFCAAEAGVEADSFPVATTAQMLVLLACAVSWKFIALTSLRVICYQEDEKHQVCVPNVSRALSNTPPPGFIFCNKVRQVCLQHGTTRLLSQLSD